MKVLLFIVALLFTVGSAVERKNTAGKVETVLSFKLTRDGEFVRVNSSINAVAEAGVTADAKVEAEEGSGSVSVVSVNGTPNNLQLDVNDPVHLDLTGFFSSSSDRSVSYVCYSLPPGIKITKEGTITGVAEKAGQYLVYISGDDGTASAVMSPFWIVIANEDGSIPSYVPALTPTRTATFSVSLSPSTSSSFSPSPIPPSSPPEFLIPPKIVSFVPNFVSPISAAVSIDVSDCFAYQPNIHFIIKGLPSGVDYNAKTGLITGCPDELGQWQVSVTATDGYSQALLPQFKFIVSTTDGNWVNVPVRFEEDDF